MANPFQAEYDAIITELKTARSNIDQSVANPNIVSLKNRILGVLTREIGNLEQRGDKIETVGETQKRSSQPLRSFLGNSLPEPNSRKKAQINKTPTGLREFNQKVQETTEEVEGKEINQRVKQIYPDFVNMPTDKIRDSFSDKEILGVAKKSELPITAKTLVDTKLIEQIKIAIKKQNEIRTEKEAQTIPLKTEDKKDGENKDK